MSAAPLDGDWKGDAVAAELRIWAREPFDRRSANCALSVLSYVERATGSARLRWPRLLAARAWPKVWERPDRLEAVALQALEQLGCRETLAPQRGDVGLIEQANGLTAAICVGRGHWAARSAAGVVIEPDVALIAWRVRCRRR